ncbi:conserved hypothetical protein [Histoplasma capsulatum G186AR]|uniref:Zn(2)-C6 fungal-type domain-containing protein n=2 Tax=Ajellomyces capsulatus TaxID=5037 RepID=C0NYI5_AJECG|nr:uncharacterized protein HCBG_07667 [Histoplasma capsulatum G186AR]EEH03541.1 conserved hypothetical protein [Histoplasma capsulatum G186AR]KAG5293889.1 C6 transcription factor [Histoplasma capsulatum]QSS75341.1 C6 transcription factor [Histoplasma capsulatum G186AR]
MSSISPKTMENNSDWQPGLSYMSDGVSGDQDESAQEGQADDSRKRKRLTITTSCELCRTRKVKCDRAEPSCGWCTRNSRVCVYRERQRPGFRSGYGRELEQKINRLEAMLQLLGRRLELHIVEHESERDSRPPPQPQLPTTRKFTPDSELRRSAPVDISSGEASSSVENRHVDGVEYERAQPPGAISVQSLTKVNALESTGNQESSGAIGLTIAGLHETIFELDLPPQGTLYTIVDLYFKHVNPWCPILDRKATLDRLFGSSVPDEAGRVLLYAIVRTTLRFYRDHSLTSRWRGQYDTISKQKILLYAFENTNIDALQALMILALDVLGKSYGPQSWTLLSMIVRNVIQLGLGTERGVTLGPPSYQSVGTLQEFALPQPTSWIENEGRRRLFWMTYILDRYACVEAGSDFTLDERQTDRPLPCRYDLFSKNQAVETRRFFGPGRPEFTVNHAENLGSFSYHCEVLRILSRIHKFLRNPIDIVSPVDFEKWQATYRGLDRELDRWLYSLPDGYSRISQLCHSSPTSRISNWIMLHAAFVVSVLRLHSCAAYPIVRSQIFAPSYSAMQRCIAAVESLREIVQDVVNTGMLDLLGPHFAFSLWVSARVLLVDASVMNTDINPNIWFFLSTLEKMGQFWGVAKRYSQILERILQEYQEAKRVALTSPTSSSSHSPQSSGPKSLRDMRRNAYDLSILLARRSASALQLPSVKVPASNELEYYEVFDFFNYPRPSVVVVNHHPPLTTTSAGSKQLETNGLESWARPKTHFVSTNFTYSRTDPDWLAFQPPQD